MNFYMFNELLYIYIENVVKFEVLVYKVLRYFLLSKSFY